MQRYKKKSRNASFFTIIFLQNLIFFAPLQRYSVTVKILPQIPPENFIFIYINIDSF